MIVNIQIDIESIVEEFLIAPEDAMKLTDSVVKEITGRYAQELENEANNTLKANRQQYIASIVVADEGFGKGSVSLVGWLPNAVEQGLDGFDMKPGLLSGKNAKQGKDGTRYNTVPFSWGTPEALSENFSNIMPQEIYEVVQPKKTGRVSNVSTSLKESEIPKPFDQIQKKTVKMPKTNELKEFQHKNSIYEGIRKRQDSVTKQNSYESFRRVSENSDPASFIHPGIEAVNIFGKVEQNFNVAAELGRAIDAYLAQL